MTSGDLQSDEWLRPLPIPGISDAVDRVQHSGDGSTRSFQITVPFRNANDIKVWVFLDTWTVKTRYEDFDIEGTTLTFVSGQEPPAGTNNVEFWVQTPRGLGELRNSWEHPASYIVREVEASILPWPIQLQARGTAMSQTRRWFEFNRTATNAFAIPVPTDIVLTDLSVVTLHGDASPPATWDIEFYKNVIVTGVPYHTEAVPFKATAGVMVTTVNIDPIVDLDEGDRISFAFAGTATDFPWCQMLLFYRRRIIHE